VTGFFQGTEYFDQTNGIASLGEDIYLAKLAGIDGSFQWVRAFGSVGSDHGYGVAVDSAGNVAITGWFAGSVNFGGAAPLVSIGGLSGFVAKYSSTGAYQWARPFTGAGVDMGNGVAMDSANNVIVTGSFQTATDFGSALLTSIGGTDAFVAKYSSAGVPQWVHAYGSTSDDAGYGVAADGSGNVVATGNFQRTANFGGPLLTSAGYLDIYVTKVGP
jgi:uncharacterized protein (AIM24 family)